MIHRISVSIRALSVALLLGTVLLGGCKGDRPDDNHIDTTIGQTPVVTPAPAVPEYTYEVVNSYPHDTAAFTEGLFFKDGVLYESTGLEGHSFFRTVSLTDGKVLKQVDLADQYFGEGIAAFKGRLYQLTYRTNIGFVYDLFSFQRIDTFNYYGEGWGMTADSTSLIMSDGTSYLRFLDPENLSVRRTLGVHAGNSDVANLNELEWVEGEIYANIWQTERIARIDPATGAVTGWIDLAGILPPMLRSGREDVMNGIAYDASQKRLFVTGKNWSRLFEIRLKPKKLAT